MLQRLGTKLINQANNTDALKKLGKTKNVDSLRDAINQLFDEVGPNNENSTRLNDVRDKAKKLLTLIKENILGSKKSKNFEQEEMQTDKTDVQDIIFRIESIHMTNVDQLKEMNDLYKKHIKVEKLIKDCDGKL